MQYPAAGEEGDIFFVANPSFLAVLPGEFSFFGSEEAASATAGTKGKDAAGSSVLAWRAAGFLLPGSRAGTLLLLNSSRTHRFLAAPPPARRPAIVPALLATQCSPCSFSFFSF